MLDNTLLLFRDFDNNYVTNSLSKKVTYDKSIESSRVLPLYCLIDQTTTESITDTMYMYLYDMLSTRGQSYNMFSYFIEHDDSWSNFPNRRYSLSATSNYSAASYRAERLGHHEVYRFIPPDDAVVGYTRLSSLDAAFHDIFIQIGATNLESVMKIINYYTNMLIGISLFDYHGMPPVKSYCTQIDQFIDQSNIRKIEHMIYDRCNNFEEFKNAEVTVYQVMKLHKYIQANYNKYNKSFYDTLTSLVSSKNFDYILGKDIYKLKNNQPLNVFCDQPIMVVRETKFTRLFMINNK